MKAEAFGRTVVIECEDPTEFDRLIDSTEQIVIGFGYRLSEPYMLEHDHISEIFQKRRKKVCLRSLFTRKKKNG